MNQNPKLKGQSALVTGATVALVKELPLHWQMTGLML